MKKIPLITTIVSLLLIAPLIARESWPAVSEATKKRLEETKKHEDEVWAKIEPEIEAWGKKGKPYIPWAAKPEDLPQSPVLAFPGAEGGGAHSFGGRGGKVYAVTSLEDSGPGTFREALEAAGPRIVVFNVAGIIHLKTRVSVQAPYITIDGSHAPGDGICIAGATTEFDTHDVIIRCMRFRRGEMDVGDRDDALGGDPIGNIIVDHCSTSWGFDENLSMYRHMYDKRDGSPAKKLPTVNITISWCISEEGLDTYNHGFGGTWGGRNSTFHHDLFACNPGRNPSIGMDREFNFVNNVLFNWRHRTVDGGDNTSLGNIINNYYKPGPATPTDAPISYRIVKPESQRGKNIPLNFGKFYVAGNVVEGNEKVTNDNWAGGVQIRDAQDKEPADEAKLIAGIRMEKPFPMAPVTTTSAKDAYEAVLVGVGATQPKRDPVDTRVIEAVRTGKTEMGAKHDGVITDMKQVSYPEYNGDKVVDSDGDGMPDAWEKEHGLNPNDPSDAAKDLAGDGYTSIEKYLFGMDPTKKIEPPAATQPTLSASAEDDAAEAKYSAAIEQRTADILALLDITDAAKKTAVHDAIIAQYRALRDWHDSNDPKLKDKSTPDATREEIKSSLKKLHEEFIAKLNANLSPEQVEKVKDKMVYGKVQVTMAAYEQIAGPLSAEQKTTILKYLKDAREEAMDGGSADEKSAIFKKYKGKINNYLSQQGIDMKQKEKEWGQRQKEAKAAATKPADS